MGLFLSRTFQITLVITDLLLVLSGILFASILNDYFDYLKLGEKNRTATLLESGTITKFHLLFLILVPGITALTLLYLLYLLNISAISLIMLFCSFTMSILYCTPPFRFKEKKITGLIFPPLGIYLLFLQGVFIHGIPDLNSIIISINIFLFAWYLEFLHLADDAVTENELTKINYRKSLNAAVTVCLTGSIVSLLSLYFSALSVIFIIFWIQRFLAIKHIRPHILKNARRNIFSQIYCIEEFPVIIAACILQRIFLQ
jgi:hypothetical protein